MGIALALLNFPKATLFDRPSCSIFKISQKEDPFNIADLGFGLSESDSAFEITNPHSAIRIPKSERAPPASYLR
jgi:hypothetical protein